MSHILENLQDIQDRISKKAKEAGRKPEEVRLIAVSKTFPALDISEAYKGGQRDFAENRVLEGEEKSSQLKDIKFFYHLIGHLQSNKVHKAVRIFNMIHSVDSLSLAKKIHTSSEQEGKKMPILLQVNKSEEAQKSGVSGGQSELLTLVEGVLGLSSLELLGLMTIGPLSMDEKETRKAFSHLREDLNTINQNFGLSLSQLSMGMTHDFLWAIEEGATMVRVGNGIFGKRPYQTA